ncbi:MAG: diaminopimelate epimerase [Chlamydiales bacterium]
MRTTQQLSQSTDPSIQEQTLDSQVLALPYVKGEGCGNTFLIFDWLDSSSEVGPEVIQAVHSLLIKENRDDALILKKEYQTDHQFVLTMIVLEPDQSIAEFCGNGARVVSRYLQHKMGDQKLEYYLKTSQGMRKIWWENTVFFVDMGVTKLHFRKSKFFRSTTFTLGLGVRQFTFFWTETLEPHLVTFDEIHENELMDLGLYLNHHQRQFFPFGINLNKAELLSERGLRVTTFERGVNRITAACGTGATSCAMLARAQGRLQGNGPIQVFLKAGTIMIHPKKRSSVMSGPANIE